MTEHEILLQRVALDDDDAEIEIAQALVIYEKHLDDASKKK